MAEETGSLIMDSGAFLDVIPIILSYLDLKSLIQLSKTCHFWRQRIYTDVRLWSKRIIELPYIGDMGCDNYRLTDCQSLIEIKLWSAILPPPDPNALEKVLDKMASSQESIQRFQLVEKIYFKNYIHTDESLRLTALLFPSIKQISFEGNLLTKVGVGYIAKSCSKLKHIEFYKCARLDMSNIFEQFNTEEHQMNLERIFLYDDIPTYNRKLLIEDSLPFMALCQRCGLYFNQFKNDKEKLCLYHPGKYDGYGHSCSSFDCCRSNTPDYPSTFGCQYTYHTKISKSSEFISNRYYELRNGHPEYMFEKFDYKLFTLRCSARRRLDGCYKKWNIKQQQQEEE